MLEIVFWTLQKNVQFACEEIVKVSHICRENCQLIKKDSRINLTIFSKLSLFRYTQNDDDHQNCIEEATYGRCHFRLLLSTNQLCRFPTLQPGPKIDLFLRRAKNESSIMAWTSTLTYQINVLVRLSNFEKKPLSMFCAHF